MSEPCRCMSPGPVIGHGGHCCLANVPDDADHTTPATEVMPCHPEALTRLRDETGRP